MRLLSALLVCSSLFGAARTASKAGNASDSTVWGASLANGDTIALGNYAVTQDIPGLILGTSGAPVNGYLQSLTGTNGSGYNTCTASLSGGTAQRAGSVDCYVVNGAATPVILDRGAYSVCPTLTTTTTATSSIATPAGVTKGNPTTLYITGNGAVAWLAGSTQSITITGITGAGGWTGINGTWSATSSGDTGGGNAMRVTIPLDSSAYTGSPGGTGAVAGNGAGPFTLTCNAGGGTAAVAIGGVTGKLIVAADTYVRGTFGFSNNFGTHNDFLVVNPGKHLYMDHTGAPAGAVYRIEGTSAYADRNILMDCSAGAQCSIEGLNGATSIDTGSGTASVADFRLTMKNALWKNVGDEQTVAISKLAYSSQTVAGNTVIDASVFDHCGRIVATIVDGDTFQITGSVWKNTPVNGGFRPVNLSITSLVAKTTGVRLIDSSVFDGSPVNPAAASGVSTWTDFTITNNWLGGSWLAASTYVEAAFSYNFVHMGRWSCTASNCAQIMAPTRSYNYYFVDAEAQNPHFVAPAAGSTGTNEIYGVGGVVTGDSGELLLPPVWPGSLLTTAIANSILLPDPDGKGCCELASTVAATNTVWSLTHNTWPGYTGQFGPASINETNSTRAGGLLMQNNLLWSPVAAPYLKTSTMGATALQDVCSPVSNCDYNGAGPSLVATQGVCTGCTNQGNGYAGNWSATPGTHDVNNQQPNFVDPYRFIELWDRKYRGQTSTAVYDAGTSYSQGDKVSRVNGGYYGWMGGGSNVVNYRCIAAAGCPAGNGPGGAGNTWRLYWEFAAFDDVRSLIVNHTTITDAAIGCVGCKPVQALVQWIQAGYTPQNSAFKAANDGGWMGAQAGVIGTAGLSGPLIW